MIVELLFTNIESYDFNSSLEANGGGWGCSSSAEGARASSESTRLSRAMKDSSTPTSRRVRAPNRPITCTDIEGDRPLLHPDASPRPHPRLTQPENIPQCATFEISFTFYARI